jgi:uncharacterized FAD-dependent dehydrogenase
MGRNGERKAPPESFLFSEARSTNAEVTLPCDSAILASGHSARDVYEMLHSEGVVLEPKGFAVGFRIEHPQSEVNQWQYGEEWKRRVVTGKKRTDLANDSLPRGGVPVASYRLATDSALDSSGSPRGCYSFCMCPGGQIVQASTEDDMVVVNGMSFSRRDSMYANSAVVVSLEPDDKVLEEYREEHGVLAGLRFQEEMERRGKN